MQLCFAGILRSRGGFLERAARLGEEEDATVTTNTRIIDFNIDHLRGELKSLQVASSILGRGTLPGPATPPRCLGIEIGGR